MVQSSNFKSSERHLLQAYGLDLGEVGVQEAVPRRGVLPDGEDPAPQAPHSRVRARRPAPEEAKCSVEVKQLQTCSSMFRVQKFRTQV